MKRTLVMNILWKTKVWEYKFKKYFVPLWYTFSKLQERTNPQGVGRKLALLRRIPIFISSRTHNKVLIRPVCHQQIEDCLPFEGAISIKTALWNCKLQVNKLVSFEFAPSNGKKFIPLWILGGYVYWNYFYYFV